MCQSKKAIWIKSLPADSTQKILHCSFVYNAIPIKKKKVDGFFVVFVFKISSVANLNFNLFNLSTSVFMFCVCLVAELLAFNSQADG